MSTQLMSTEPVRRAPRLNYWAVFGRVLIVVGAIVMLAIAPPMLAGRLRLPATLPALAAPHAPDLAVIGAASLAIKLHLAVVLAVAVVGIVLMARVKGTPLHRQLGWIYASGMFFTGLVTLAIPAPPAGPHVGPFGPLHLFSLFTLAAVPRAIFAARRGDWVMHGRLMASLFIGGIGIAGVLAFLPGRVMNQMFFG